MNYRHAGLWDQFQLAASRASQHGQLGKAARIIKEGLREAEEYNEISGAMVDTAHALAEVYLRELRFGEAEMLYRAVLEVREKLLGQSHPDVIDSLKKVAFVQIMAFRAEALGPSSVRTIPFACTPDTIAAAS